ncbi:hypothetical protein HK101_001322 [Irineochytrium annulatum]|nr:hypothetical protein HK101_001322 [Irineochytrium annulatum]
MKARQPSILPFGLDAYLCSMRPDLLAFIGLITIQVTVAVIYKVSSSSGSYKFALASSLAISEFVKMALALLLLCYTVRYGDGGGGAKKATSVPAPIQMTAVVEGDEERGLMVGAEAEDGASSSSDAEPARDDGTALDRSIAILKASCTARNLLMIGPLAAMYAFNNHLAFRLFLLADPGTIALIKAGSTFISAFILTLFGRTQAKLQWVSIFLQLSGIITSQYDPSNGAAVYSLYTYFLLGLSVTITALCGCVNDMINKNMNLSLHTINFFLYAIGFMLNMCVYIFTAISDPTAPGFFQGYDLMACVLVLCNCLIGIAITAVYKYADAVIKTIAQTCSTSILIFISFLFFGATINLLTVTGVITIFLATYVYFVAGQQHNQAGGAAAVKAAPKVAVGGEDVDNLKEKRAVKKYEFSDGAKFGCGLLVFIVVVYCFQYLSNAAGASKGSGSPL